MIRHLQQLVRVLLRDGLILGAMGMILSPLAGYWLWQSSHDELALINHARLANAYLVSTAAPSHPSRDGDYSVEGKFSFRLQDGTEDQITRAYDTLDDIPDTVEVEYLPEKPEVKRIKGTGSSNTEEWKFWLGFKYVLIAVWFVVSAAFLVGAIKDNR